MDEAADFVPLPENKWEKNLILWINHEQVRRDATDDWTTWRFRRETETLRAVNRSGFRAIACPGVNDMHAELQWRGCPYPCDVITGRRGGPGVLPGIDLKIGGVWRV